MIFKIYMYIYIHACTHTHTYIYRYIYIYIYIYVCVCVCVYMYIYICTCIYLGYHFQLYSSCDLNPICHNNSPEILAFITTTLRDASQRSGYDCKYLYVYKYTYIYLYLICMNIFNKCKSEIIANEDVNTWIIQSARIPTRREEKYGRECWMWRRKRNNLHSCVLLRGAARPYSDWQVRRPGGQCVMKGEQCMKAGSVWKCVGAQCMRGGCSIWGWVEGSNLWRGRLYRIH